jgi:hypothetical protein
MTTIPLGSIEPLAFLGALDSAESTRLYAPFVFPTFVARDGSYYEIPVKDPSEFKTFAAEKLKHTAAPALKMIGFAVIPQLDPSWVALTPDGVLVSYPSGTPVAATKNERFRKIIAPFFWSPRLQEL